MAAIPEEIIKQNKMGITSKDLPQEIITQILYGVPAKSIGRFRSVSKGWLSLLTHPDFIKTHDQNTLIHKHRLIFNTTDNSNIECPGLYSNPDNEPILRISDFGLDGNLGRYNCIPYLLVYGSCNGLVMVSADSYIHFLINPTTKESMKLPKISDYSYMNDYKWSWDVIIYKSEYMHGLGYDSDTGDFKVVSLNCLYGIMKHGCIFVHVYSLRTNTWRRLTDTLDDYHCEYSEDQSAVFVNGFLHWIFTKRVNRLESKVILAFSLADDKFSEVTSPEFVGSNEYLSSDHCRLVLLGGKLALFHRLDGEIWLMNECRIKESWTKISLHGIHKIPMVSPDRYNKPMVFCHDGKFMVANSDRMMVYDDEKGAFEETVCVWDPVNFRVIGSFVESLVSIASCIEQ